MTEFHRDTPEVTSARNFLAGADFEIETLQALWKALKNQNEWSLARRVLKRGLKEKKTELSAKEADKIKWTQQLAHCTSQDTSLGFGYRTRRALDILEECDLTAVLRKHNISGEHQETLGIAGGIYKRKWRQFAQNKDLRKSLNCYEKGAKGDIKNDFGYNAINAAYISDILATIEPSKTYPEEARKYRQFIVDNMPETEYDGWWYYATLMEAHVGLGNYREAKENLDKAAALKDVPYWEYETTTRQLVEIYLLQKDQGSETDPEFRKIISELLFKTPRSGDEAIEAESGMTDKEREQLIDQTFVGTVGLALSGGGFRASFFHLGLLAKLAELDLLRHISSLSTVSGGSIVGAAYYLKLKDRYEQTGAERMIHQDYIDLVAELIKEFKESVDKNMRKELFEPIRTAFTRETGKGLGMALKLGKVYRCFKKGKLANLRKLLPETSKAYENLGVLDTEKGAGFLQEHFYQKLLSQKGEETIMMHDLQISPFDHNIQLGDFHPTRHNWRRAHKIPALTINATSANTGHGWQFTSTWMGESPYEEMEYNCIPRLRRCRYGGARDVPLGKAVAASAAVPGVFQPVILKELFETEHGSSELFDVRLVDGGVFDNQGTFSLIEQNCSVLIVSDAAGQMAMETEMPGGIFGPVNALKRTMDMFMERIRQANLSDLLDRVEDNRLRSAMIVHAQDDLHTAPLDWAQCEDPTTPTPESSVTRCGINREIQQALCEIRTDLDDFHDDEANALMAFGYRLAEYKHTRTIKKNLPQLLAEPLKPDGGWSFEPMLPRICSQTTDADLLHNLTEAKKALGQREYK